MGSGMGPPELLLGELGDAGRQPEPTLQKWDRSVKLGSTERDWSLRTSVTILHAVLSANAIHR
jgi:hypothetical protein